MLFKRNLQPNTRIFSFEIIWSIDFKRTNLTLKIHIDFVFPYDDIGSQSFCTYIRFYFHFTFILLFIDIDFDNISINNDIINNF